MKYIGYTLLLASMFLFFGIVGGMEHNTMSMAGGMVNLVVCLAIGFVGDRIIKKYEEKEND